MGPLETRGPAENFRDISYSEISLPFREIPEEVDDKLWEVHILLEQYINVYFEQSSEDLEGVLNYSIYETRSSIFRNPFMFDGQQSVRLLEALENAIKNQITIEGIDIDSIFGLAIKDGVLLVYYGDKNSDQSLKFDLTRKTVGKLYIQEVTKAEVDALEEETLLEETMTVVGSVTAVVSIATSTIYRIESRTIRRIRINGADGAEILIEGRFPITSGGSTKEIHVLDILERNNIVLDPESMQFEDLRKNRMPVSLIRIEKQLRSLKKPEFIKKLLSLGIDTSAIESMSEHEFESIQRNMAQIFQEIREQGSTSQMTTREIIKEIIRNPRYAKIYLTGGLLILGLDVFSGAFEDPDDLGSYIAEAAVIGGFSLGIMGGGPLIRFLQGARFGKKIPTGPGKIIGGLLLGFGTVIGGTYISKTFLDINNNFTRAYPEREDWIQKYGFNKDFDSSRILNTALGGFMYSVIDGYEHIGKNLPDLPWFDTRDGLDTFLYNSSIDLGTDPLVYMSMTHTRDIFQWNRRVEIYRENALSEIKSLIEEYRQKNNNGSAEVKQEFSADLLRVMGTPEGETRYINMRVYDRILGYFGNNNFHGYEQIIMSGEMALEDILTLISHELGKLEIDTGYKEDFQEDLNFEKMVIKSALDGNSDGIELAKIQLTTSRGEFSQGIINYDDLAFIATLPQEQRDFLKRITERIYNRERIIKEGFYIDQDGNKITKKDYYAGVYRSVYTGSGDIPPGMIQVEYVTSEDEQMWKYFTGGIDEYSIHQQSGLNLDMNSEAVTHEPSQLFFRFFDRIVEVKKSGVFLDNITKGHSGRSWKGGSVWGELSDLAGFGDKNDLDN